MGRFAARCWTGAKSPIAGTAHACIAFAALLLAAAPCRADCEDGVAELVARMAPVNEPHLRALLEADLKRAQFELWEFDEVECAIALEHANRLLAARGSGAPAPGNPGQ